LHQNLLARSIAATDVSPNKGSSTTTCDDTSSTPATPVPRLILTQSHSANTSRPSTKASDIPAMSPAARILSHKGRIWQGTRSSSMALTLPIAQLVMLRHTHIGIRISRTKTKSISPTPFEVRGCRRGWLPQVSLYPHTYVAFLNTSIRLYVSYHTLRKATSEAQEV
jgi:hypothetical protein